MNRKLLKNKLKNNELSFGTWITIGHPSIPEILSYAGFDWMVIDIEHTTIDLSMVQSLIASIQAKNIVALVRITENEKTIIKRVLDAGADGVIIPMVNSAGDARKAVDHTKYPPIGKRGVGLARAQGYGYQFEDYKDTSGDIIIIAQIEHVKAIENLEEIIKVIGIDGTIIGPYDLSGSVGHPGEYDIPQMKELLNSYQKVSTKMEKIMGYHVVSTDPGDVLIKIKEGYNFIAFGTDFYFMGDMAISGLNKIK